MQRVCCLIIFAVSITACGASGAPSAPARAPTPAARATSASASTLVVPTAPAPTRTQPPLVAAASATRVPPVSKLPAGFTVLDPTGSYPQQVREIREKLPEVLEYLTSRAGRRLSQPLTVVVSRIREGDPCAVRGLALAEGRQIYLYLGRDTPASVINAGLAHELGHVLQAQEAGGNVASVTLAEGFATWVAGRYWPQWTSERGFAPAVRRYRRQNSYIPLTASALPCDTDTRDRIYTERAAFVEWLLATYGADRFWQLNRHSARPAENTPPAGELPYVRPPVITENATYESAPWIKVYGKELVDLEKEWLSGLG